MTNLFAIAVDSTLGLSISISGLAVIAACVLALALIAARLYQSSSSWKSFEVDEAEFGLGNQRLRLSPNRTDKQIAYKIWVELSTRKIGLPIDLDHDVIDEIYDSWFNFFSVTRELIKEVPVQKFSRPGTERIVRLSIDVLNVGLRPHLTQWQARFRRWYARQMGDADQFDVHPQDIQKRFPHYAELESDLLIVNARLISYRQTMLALVKGK